MSSLKITQEIKNPLFERKEIVGKIECQISPSRVEIEDQISKILSVPIGNIKVKSILGQFGSKEFTIKANVYSSKEYKEKIEIKTKKEKEADKKAEGSSPEPKKEEIKAPAKE